MQFMMRIGLLAWLALPVFRPAFAALGTESVIHGHVPARIAINAPVPVVLNVPSELADRPLLLGRLTINGQPAGTAAIQTERADPISATPARGWFLHTFTLDQLGKPIEIKIDSQHPSTQNAFAEKADAYRIQYSNPLVQIATPEGKPVLSYRHGKPDPALKYPMTSYIHPLVGLDGEILTDCSPKDHYHQRGLFWAWVRIQKDDQTLGDWWQPRGIMLDPKNLNVTAGPVFARFIADHDYIYQPNPDSQPASGVRSGERLFHERVVCRVFITTPGGRAIDVDLTITALQDGMKIGGQTEKGKGYGGLTLRFSRSPDGKGQATEPRIIADGHVIEEETVNHLKAFWVDWTGLFLGPDHKRLTRRSGGAVFVHPSHPPLPTSPPEWITRAYGPINVAYPNLAMLDVPQNKPLRLRYRVWLHRDDAMLAGVDAYYRGYAADWQWTSKP